MAPDSRLMDQERSVQGFKQKGREVYHRLRYYFMQSHRGIRVAVFAYSIVVAMWLFNLLPTDDLRDLYLGVPDVDHARMYPGGTMVGEGVCF